MGKELEWKYAVDRAALAALEKEPGSPWRKIDMETRYFDTPDGALSARRWTLRLRQENELRVGCLKTPLPDGARGEWETPCESVEELTECLIAAGAPTELRQLTGGQPLQEVCGAKFTRLARDVETGGSRVEVALDRGVLRGGGREIPLCEAEVEHKSGDPAASAVWAADLAKRHSLQPEEKSKFARALALARQ